MSGRWGLWVLVLGLLAGCAEQERTSLADGQLMEGAFDFGEVRRCTASEKSVLLRNVGRSRITVGDIWVESPDGESLTCTLLEEVHDLQPLRDYGLKVRCEPWKLGTLKANLVIRSDSKHKPIHRMALNVSGVPAPVKVSPLMLDFGRIEADSSKPLHVTVENPPENPQRVVVSMELEGADKGEFLLSPTLVELQPGEKRELTLTFNPVKEGRKRVGFRVSLVDGCEDSVAVQVAAEALERAVIAEPAVLDFGSVPLDKDRWLTAYLRNVSTEPMKVTQLELEGKDASFSHAATGLPRVLQPGEVHGWKLRYSPGHLGLAEDTARFYVEKSRKPFTPVKLLGHGGAAELCISPMTYDFGPQPLGFKTPVNVNIKNCGSENGGPLKLTGLEFQPDPTGPVQFSSAPLPLPHTLGPGKELNLKVFYEPTREGLATGALVLTTDAFNASSVRLDFRGLAERHEPCQLAITPVAVNFGAVPPKWGAVLGVKLTHRGGGLCPVKNIRIHEDGGGVFWMPGGQLDGVLMKPGDWFSFQVAFTAPATGGTFLGSVQIEQADPANPLLLVPLQAHSQDACLVPTPRYVDFGIGRRDCPPEFRQVNYVNGCPSAIIVSGVRLGPGTTDSEFALTSAPAPLPITLQPGEAFTAEVAYYAQVIGMNLSPLFVDTSDLSEPLLVPLLGESSNDLNKTDTFVQQDGTKVDVLFVVDNTASMVEEQPRFIQALPAFVNTALNKRVDLHVAVTTTGILPESGSCPGGAQGGEGGRFFPVDGSRQRILTHQTPDLAGKLQGNAQVGQCASVEQGFEAVRRALSDPLVSGADDPRTPLPNDGNAGFLRDEAALVVVFMGDEDDHSPDSVDTYVRFFQGKKSESQPQRMMIYAIAPTAAACSTAGGAGTRYAEAAARTGGEVVSVCAPDYAPLLRSVANKAFSPQDRFPLSELPDPGSVSVRVNGAPASTGWSYDSTTNSVVFSRGPAPGAKVEISYRRACQ